MLLCNDSPRKLFDCSKLLHPHSCLWTFSHLNSADWQQHLMLFSLIYVSSLIQKVFQHFHIKLWPVTSISQCPCIIVMSLSPLHDMLCEDNDLYYALYLCTLWILPTFVYILDLFVLTHSFVASQSGNKETAKIDILLGCFAKRLWKKWCQDFQVLLNKSIQGPDI